MPDRMVVRTLEHAPFEGPGAIAAWAHKRGRHLERRRVYAGDALPVLDAPDLLVVMGGPMSANDTAAHPWLAAEITLIRDAVRRGVAVLGVCLGAQLLARALGARVYPAVEREIGWHRVRRVPLAAQCPFPFPDTITLFHWHGETFDLPPGATLIASSDACAHQVYCVGPRALGVQCHPEITPEGVRDLVAACPGDLTPGGWVQDGPQILRADSTQHAEANRLTDRLLDRLVGAEQGDPRTPRSP